MKNKNDKPEVRILVGDHQDNIGAIISSSIEEEIGDRHKFVFKTTPNADELLQIVQHHDFNISILILNNIFFPSGDFFAGNRLEKSLHLITYLKDNYKKPVIALTGWPRDNSFFGEKAIAAGADFFFPLPFEWFEFLDAIEQCLDAVTVLNEI